MRPSPAPSGDVGIARADDALAGGHSFYTELDRLFAPGFKPTEQDIIRVRVKTSGISETKFQVGDLTYSCVLGVGQ